MPSAIGTANEYFQTSDELAESTLIGQICRQLNRPTACDRPFITMSYAQSLDGSIASISGRPLAISSSPSLSFTHRLRALHDGILVGIGTVLADNPRLTVRQVPGRNPRPVILDSRLRFPIYSSILGQEVKPWILTTFQADKSRETELEKAGGRVIRVSASITGQIDLCAVLPQLKSLGLTSLLVEGGGQVITSFLTSRLVDQLVITIAPLLVGGLRILDNIGTLNHGGIPRLLNVCYERFGEDMILRGDLDWNT
jgi:3,4-dihydroxy 2-butanone 4-phosphate synthase/GTP cyclohydrolase II